MSRRCVRWVSLVVLALAVAGCGPDEETKGVIAAVNNNKYVKERGGTVKNVELFADQDKDATFPFMAEVYDEKGNAIGKVRGQRIEGLGTMVRSYVWYDEPGWEEKEARLSQQDITKDDDRDARWQEKCRDIGLETNRK